jgi:hypothetical protein
MKKKFQIFLVFFLTYAFICCPVFVGSSFAENKTNNISATATIKARIETVKAAVVFIKDNLPDWFQELNMPPTNTEEIQANRTMRKDIAQQILAKLGIDRTK